MENSKALKTPPIKREYIDKYIARMKDTPKFKESRANINKRYYNKKKNQLLDALEKIKQLESMQKI